MKGKKIISRLGAVSLLVFSVLVSVFTVVNIKSFYIKEYAKNNVEQATGMNRQDLEKTTQLFLDYLNDKRDDLSLIVTKNGVKEQVFYERETLHMIDVNGLVSKRPKDNVSAWRCKPWLLCFFVFKKARQKGILAKCQSRL